jgi:hypothetical protein
VLKLLSFPTTCMCEVGFSTHATTKPNITTDWMFHLTRSYAYPKSLQIPGCFVTI